VSIQGCSFSWSPGDAPVLHDLQLQVTSGQLVMVVGPVGSGKSSLLAAVLGEMVATAAAAAGGGGSCRVAVAGSVAYTAQVSDLLPACISHHHHHCRVGQKVIRWPRQ
jgi:ATP-binding cassette subfamily C (CFTR/MRP) protein 1